VTRISKIGNAVLRAALYLPAMSAMRYNPAIVALAARLKSRGRLKPKQIVVVRIPTKPAMHSNSKPAGYSDLKPATRGVVRMGQIHDVVEGWEGQETGWS
jgi:hypothetical protein